MFGKDEFQPGMIKHVLSSIRVDELKRMVKILHKHAERTTGKRIEKPRLGQPASHRKGDVIDWLAGVITQQQTARFVYEMMTSLEKAALSEAVHNTHGILEPVQIAAKYGMYPDIWGTGRFDAQELEMRKRRTECPLLSIVLARKRVVAQDVRKVYRSFVPKPAAAVPGQIESLPHTLRLPSGELTSEYSIQLTEQCALVDVQSMLNLVAKGKMGVGAKTGRVSKTGAKNVRQILCQGDFYSEYEETGDPGEVHMGPAFCLAFAAAGRKSGPDRGQQADFDPKRSKGAEEKAS